MSRIADIARDFAGRGGKRLRPRLCQAVFDACGGTGDLSPVCEAVESFHKASLVHDDIQDGDETRYDRPTVWKEHGVPVAIAVGDWLVAHGYLLIAQSGFPRAAQMLEATVSSHLRLCEGQGDERVYKDVIVQISNDEKCLKDVTTIFNNDHDDSAKLGVKGTDKEYRERNEGRPIDAKLAKGRYVRCYSNGSTSEPVNNYIEIEVFGK